MESNFFSNRRPKMEGHDAFTIIMTLTSVLRDKGAFFNILYDAINAHPSYVVLSDMTSERKLEIIGEIISYYEKREDYEKCASLLKIKKEIEAC